MEKNKLLSVLRQGQLGNDSVSQYIRNTHSRDKLAVTICPAN